MATLTFFSVTGKYLAALRDSVYDVDTDPELAPMSGSVTFTPLIDVGDSLPAPTLTPPANVWLVPIKAQIRSGEIRSNGSVGVKLVANTAVLGLAGNLFYRVDFTEGLLAGGKTYHPDSFTFQAPLTATTVDLVSVTPLPGSPAIGNVLPVVSVAGKTGQILLNVEDVQGAASVSQVTAAVDDLLAGAPGALDTLNELAAALGDDANFATTVTSALAGKQPSAANLTALAALTSAANKGIQFTGTGTAGTFDLTETGKAIVGAANPGAARDAIGRDVRVLKFTTTWPVRPNDDAMTIFLGGESPGDEPAVANMRDGDVWIPSTGDNAPSVADLGLDGMFASYDQGRRVLVEYTASVLGAATPGFGGNLLGAFATIQAPGGGGGSGRRGAAGTVRQGGGAASSGAILTRVWIPASWFSSTFSLVLGAVGSAGAAVTTNDTNGGNGGNGGATQLLSGANTLQALGGLGGTGGGTGAGGVGGSALTDGIPRPGVSAGGSASATGGVGGDGGTPYGLGSAGGGAGGGITSGDVASNGGNGGGNYPVGQPTPGRAGIVDTTVPAAGYLVGASPATLGPGGGAASKTAAAQAGGGFTSSAYGAGGAGGGASLNGFNSGAGTAGAPGWALIEWTFG